jgi:hypothetical protein
MSVDDKGRPRRASISFDHRENHSFIQNHCTLDLKNNKLPAFTLLEALKLGI